MDNGKENNIIIEKEYFTLHPQINEVIDKFNEEVHYYSKLHRMIDLVEVIIKTHATYIISNYLKVADISPEIKRIVSYGLKKPSLGGWQGISRLLMNDLMIRKELNESEFNEMKEIIINNSEKKAFEARYKLENEVYKLESISENAKNSLIKYYQKSNFKFSPKLFVEDFYNYFIEYDKSISNEIKLGKNKTISNVINLRNRYAHGATASEKKSQEEIEKYIDFIKKLLSAEWLNSVAVIICDENKELVRFLNNYNYIVDFYNRNIEEGLNLDNIEKNTPYFMNENGELLECFPIIFYQDNYLDKDNNDENNEEEFSDVIFFFNDSDKLEKGRLSLLNYPKALHNVKNTIGKTLLSKLNLLKWREIEVKEFEGKIEILSEGFYGREIEKKKLKDFIIKKNRGFQFIYGEGGIGKSALLAQIIKEYRNSDKFDSNNTCIIEYFIKRNTIYSEPAYFLDYLNKNLESVLQSNENINVKTIEEKYSLFLKLLNIAQSLKNKKFVFIIDGLDEGIESNLLKYLISDVYKNIIFIYSGRRYIEVEEFESRIPKGDLNNEISMQTLSDDDVRGILWSSLDKYKLFKEPEIANSVIEKSKGNPLYLKLLRNEIESGEVTLKNINEIPRSIKALFNDSITRLLNKENKDQLIHSLMIFAIAKDFLSGKHLQMLLNELGFNVTAADSIVIINTLSDILQECPNRKGYYQIFHENLRTYIREEYEVYIKDINESFIKLCSKWKDQMHLGKDFLLYSMRYYTEHLLEVDRYKEVNGLINNVEYVEMQIDSTGEYSTTFKMLEGFKAYILKDYRKDKGDFNDYILNIAVKNLEIYKLINFKEKEIFTNCSELSYQQINEYIEKYKKYYESDKVITLYLVAIYKVLSYENKEEVFTDIIDSLCDFDKRELAFIPNELIIDIVIKAKNKGYDYLELLKKLQFFEGDIEYTKCMICKDTTDIVVDYIKDINSIVTVSQILNRYRISIIRNKCFEELRYLKNRVKEIYNNDLLDYNFSLEIFNLYSDIDKELTVKYLKSYKGIGIEKSFKIIEKLINKGWIKEAKKYFEILDKKILGTDMETPINNYVTMAIFANNLKMKRESVYFDYIQNNFKEQDSYCEIINYLILKDNKEYGKYLPSVDDVIDYDEDGKIVEVFIEYYIKNQMYGECIELLDKTKEDLNESYIYGLNKAMSLLEECNKDLKEDIEVRVKELLAKDIEDIDMELIMEDMSLCSAFMINLSNSFFDLFHNYVLRYCQYSDHYYSSKINCIATRIYLNLNMYKEASNTYSLLHQFGLIYEEVEDDLDLNSINIETIIGFINECLNVDQIHNILNKIYRNLIEENNIELFEKLLLLYKYKIISGDLTKTISSYYCNKYSVESGLNEIVDLYKSINEKPLEKRKKNILLLGVEERKCRENKEFESGFDYKNLWITLYALHSMININLSKGNYKEAITLFNDIPDDLIYHGAIYELDYFEKGRVANEISNVLAKDKSSELIEFINDTYLNTNICFDFIEKVNGLYNCAKILNLQCRYEEEQQVLKIINNLVSISIKKDEKWLYNLKELKYKSQVDENYNFKVNKKEIKYRSIIEMIEILRLFDGDDNEIVRKIKSQLKSKTRVDDLFEILKYNIEIGNFEETLNVLKKIILYADKAKASKFYWDFERTKALELTFRCLLINNKNNLIKCLGEMLINEEKECIEYVLDKNIMYINKENIKAAKEILVKFNYIEELCRVLIRISESEEDLIKELMQLKFSKNWSVLFLLSYSYYSYYFGNKENKYLETIKGLLDVEFDDSLLQNLNSDNLIYTDELQKCLILDNEVVKESENKDKTLVDSVIDPSRVDIASDKVYSQIEEAMEKLKVKKINLIEFKMIINQLIKDY